MKYNYKEFIKQIVLIFLLFFMYQIVHAENPPAKLPPNVAKERDTINYILDKTQNYIKSKDWVNYDPKKEGSSISFGILKTSQALGDRQALIDAGRNVMTIDLGSDINKGIKKLIELIG